MLKFLFFSSRYVFQALLSTQMRRLSSVMKNIGLSLAVISSLFDVPLSNGAEMSIFRSEVCDRHLHMEVFLLYARGWKFISVNRLL